MYPYKVLYNNAQHIMPISKEVNQALSTMLYKA